MADTEPKQSFWTTVPGILTALGGLLTAVATLLLALSQTGIIGTDDNSGSSDDVLLSGTYSVTMKLRELQTLDTLGDNLLWEEPSPQEGQPGDEWDSQSWSFSPTIWSVAQRPKFKGTRQSDLTYFAPGQATCGDAPITTERHLVPTSGSGSPADTFSATLTIHWECPLTGTFDATFDVEGTRQFS